MCGTCGCGEDNHITYTRPGETAHHSHDHHHHDGHDHPHEHHPKEIQLELDVLSKNNKLAERNRGFLDALNIQSLNLVSSPGSGKTSLLERTVKEMRNELSFYIIEGDQQTNNDANRIAKAGAPVIQVNTGNGCHLDAQMVNHAMKQLNPERNATLIIENVGNLVCPALFDLGESKRVVIISVTEGDDKPLKYPAMFASSQLCIINKTDLLPYVDFDMEKTKQYALRVNHQLEFIEMSVKNGEGMQDWYAWLKNAKEQQ
ncbi:MAG: hydrogenase nickel incorporation protein HypB [Bacteroidales bacterium]|nr:hydrogenase nickel incorporation protein HypB [Bacteroidales bacterium]